MKNQGMYSFLKKYYKEKAQNPDVLLLFRCGEFYETYDEDAVEVSRLLNITLTRNTNGIELAGFPAHAICSYLLKLLQAGKRLEIYAEDGYLLKD